MVELMARFRFRVNGMSQEAVGKTVNNSRHGAAYGSLVTSWTRPERESIQFLCLHLVLACVKLTSWK